MEWINTPQSSNVVRFGYEEESRVLKVEFKNGSIYDYFDVPERVFSGMNRAPSVGQYLAQEIKGSYRYARA